MILFDLLTSVLQRLKRVRAHAPENDTSSFRTLRVDPRSYQIGPLLFRRFWQLAKPYWTRSTAWSSWTAYAFLVLMVPAATGAWVISTGIIASLTNAVVAHDQTTAWRMLWLLALFTAADTLIRIVQMFVDSRLQLHWRQWLTRYLVKRYLDKRTYYNISLMQDLDNPDQRIQEEIGPFVNMVSSFPRQVLGSVLQLFAGGLIIAGVTPGLFWFVFVYAVAQTLTTFFLYFPTIKQQFEITVAEADLRYGILHVRDNAETVAFYRGESAEHQQIDARLATAVRKQANYIYYQNVLHLVTGGFSILWIVVPYLLLIPLFFAGEIQFGAIAQAIAAAATMVQAMTTLSNFVPQVSAAAPKAVRLAEIIERFSQMDGESSAERVSELTVVHSSAIRLSKVRLETPGGEQALVRDLSFHVSSREPVVIIGQTGVGKSSVLRAMAGLWTRGSGTLEMPGPEQCLFLPQRPYMILANLRSQLLYPRGDANITDGEIEDALRKVRLAKLTEVQGGLAAVRDWGRILSLGEQQRIAFARVLLSKPEFVFLDEATSAVDVETETILYELLRESGATYISVGHRESILRHHDWTLELFPGGSWDIRRTRLSAAGKHPPRTAP